MNDKAVCRTSPTTPGLSIIPSCLQVKLTEVIMLTLLTIVIVVTMMTVVIVVTIINFNTFFLLFS